MVDLNPWKRKKFKWTYGEVEGAHLALQGLLEGEYTVGSNPLTRSLNKLRAQVQIGSLERAMAQNELPVDTPGLLATMKLNPALTRFFRNTVNAAIDHYTSLPGAEPHQVDTEQINVLRGLSSVLTRQD